MGISYNITWVINGQFNIPKILPEMADVPNLNDLIGNNLEPDTQTAIVLNIE